MKKWKSTFLQSWPLGFDFSIFLKDLGKKTPSKKALESSEVNEEGNNPSDWIDFWGLGEDLDNAEDTEQTSTFAAVPARGTGDKVLLIDAIHRNNS